MKEMKKNVFIKEYAEQLKCGKASLFIGSGISRKAGYANWKDVLRDCAEEIELNVDAEQQDLITLAEYYVRDKQRTKITQTIAEFFSDKKGAPVKVHEIISHLPVNSIWTTNYDTLIERSLKAADISYSVITDDKSYTNLDRSAQVIVHKIHGDVGNADKCIITRKDYENFEKDHDIVLSELKGEMCTNSFLFLGYGFKDTDIQHILSKIRLAYEENHPQRHYCILEKVKSEDYSSEEEYKYKQKKQEHHVADMQSYGINVVLVDSYDQIEDILTEIKVRVHINDVLICGAYEDGTRNKDNRIAPLAEKLSTELIAKGYRIFTGYGKNLGANIVAGAFKGCAGAGSVAKAFNENVFLFPFPYKLPDGTDRKKFYTDLRSNMVSKAQISIFISGEKLDNGVLINSPGVMEEYELSKQQGNLIIPVASTGGAALAIWNKMEEDGFNGDIDLYKSLSEELNPDKIVDKIFEILNSYTKKYR